MSPPREWLLWNTTADLEYNEPQITERSGVEEGMKVLEIGCGRGGPCARPIFTTFVARAVGQRGEAPTLDIQPAMLAQLERKLRQPENEDIQNVRL